MKIGIKGIALISEFEGCKLHAYADPATHGEPYTIGVGHTGTVDGVKVHMGMTITQEKANELLEKDTERFTPHIPTPATQNQFDAMLSLCFNIGPGAFDKSLIKRMHKLGYHKGAAKAFLMYNKAAGKVMAGLTRRREAEKALYERG